MMQRRILFFLALLFLNGCDRSTPNTFQGYVEGEFIYLASSGSGRLEELPAVRGINTEADTVLFRLDAEHERHALRQAEQTLLEATALLKDMETGKRPEEVAMAVAQLNQAKAEEANATALLHRHKNLVNSGGVSKQEFDTSQSTARAAAARVVELTRQIEVYNLPEREQRLEAQQAVINVADAQVAQARWDLAQKQISAPADGLIYDTFFRVGEWVATGNPVVQLLPPDHVKIRFFVPEKMISQLEIGNQVLVHRDGKDNAFPAVISYIAVNAEYTPPIIYSNETRSKLVFMAEARPDLTVATSLHPGQPVNVTLP